MKENQVQKVMDKGEIQVEEEDEQGDRQDDGDRHDADTSKDRGRNEVNDKQGQRGGRKDSLEVARVRNRKSHDKKRAAEAGQGGSESSQSMSIGGQTAEHELDEAYGKAMEEIRAERK